MACLVILHNWALTSPKVLIQVPQVVLAREVWPAIGRDSWIMNLLVIPVWLSGSGIEGWQDSHGGQKKFMGPEPTYAVLYRLPLPFVPLQRARMKSSPSLWLLTRDREMDQDSLAYRSEFLLQEEQVLIQVWSLGPDNSLHQCQLLLFLVNLIWRSPVFAWDQTSGENNHNKNQFICITWPDYLCKCSKNGDWPYKLFYKRALLELFIRNLRLSS